MRNIFKKKNEGDGMEKSIFIRKDIQKIDEEIKKSEGFFIGISILNANKKLQHYFIADNFQKGDFKNSLNEIKKLIKKDLYDSGDNSLAKEL